LSATNFLKVKVSKSRVTVLCVLEGNMTVGVMMYHWLMHGRDCVKSVVGLCFLNRAEFSPCHPI